MDENKMKVVNTLEKGSQKVDQAESVACKKIEELSIDELNHLPVCDLDLVRSKSKKSGNIIYSVKFSLLPSLTVSGYITEALFFILVKVLKLNEGYDKYRVKVHYRLSYGLRKDAADENLLNPKSAYYIFEAVLYKGKFWQEFLSREQIDQIRICNLLATLKPIKRMTTEVGLVSEDNAKVAVLEVD